MQGYLNELNTIIENNDMKKPFDKMQLFIMILNSIREFNNTKPLINITGGNIENSDLLETIKTLIKTEESGESGFTGGNKFLSQVWYLYSNITTTTEHDIFPIYDRFVSLRNQLTFSKVLKTEETEVKQSEEEEKTKKTKN